jgi:type IV pilus assembly protein PilA
MRKLHTRRGGFTLIELMIVVAIIGILAAIAIPNFLKFQLRSKTGEAKTNLAALRTAEEGYFAEYGVFVPAPAAVPAAPGPSKQQWPSPAAGFDTVGWGPEGEVYFQYMANAVVGNTFYTLEALGDLDGGVPTSDFGYIHLDPAGNATPATITTCQITGVYNASTAAQDLIDTVGQCEQLDGQEEF